MTKKPEGHIETESLLRKLVQVPKKELDTELRKYKNKAKRRKK